MISWDLVEEACEKNMDIIHICQRCGRMMRIGGDKFEDGYSLYSDIYTDRAAHKYRNMLEDAGYQCNVAKEEHKYSDDNTEHDLHSYFTTVIALIWK